MKQHFPPKLCIGGEVHVQSIYTYITCLFSLTLSNLRFPGLFFNTPTAQFTWEFTKVYKYVNEVNFFFPFPFEICSVIVEIDLFRLANFPMAMMAAGLKRPEVGEGVECMLVIRESAEERGGSPALRPSSSIHLPFKQAAASIVL